MIKINEDLLCDESRLKVSMKRINRSTQTKLYAILLPESPLSEIKQAYTEVRTRTTVTQTCQVNTLSYLIETDDNRTEIPHSLEDIPNVKHMDYPSTVAFLHNETEVINELLLEEKPCDKKSLTQMKYQMSFDPKHDEQKLNTDLNKFDKSQLLDAFKEEKLHSVSTNEEFFSNKEQKQQSILTLSPFKCINACHTIDLDEPNVSIASRFDNDTISTLTLPAQGDRSIDKYLQTYSKAFNNSNSQIIE